MSQQKEKLAEEKLVEGDRYLWHGSYEEAMNAYEQAIKIQSNYAEAYYGLGRAYSELGLTQEAIQAYNQAIQIKPDSPDAHYYLAMAYEKTGNLLEAANTYKNLAWINSVRAKYISSLDYSLKIDSQVEKFLELKQKVTFFLITAAIGSVGFTLNFSVNRLDKFVGAPFRTAWLITGCLLGLIAAASTLLSLDQETSSHRIHLKARYQNILSFQQLTKKEQNRWKKVNHRAKIFQRVAFVLLISSILFQAAVFISFLS